MGRVIFVFLLILKTIDSYAQEAIGVIMLGDSTRIATGFVAQHEDIVITCNHVESQNKGLKIFQPKGSLKIYNLKLLTSSIKYDIAIYQANEKITPNYLLIDTAITFSPKLLIRYVGYNAELSSENEWALSEGSAVVEATGYVYRPKDIETTFVEFRGASRPGFSGGPVMNPKGYVIAILREAWMRQGLIHGSDPVLIDRAVSAGPVLKLLASLKQ